MANCKIAAGIYVMFCTKVNNLFRSKHESVACSEKNTRSNTNSCLYINCLSHVHKYTVQKQIHITTYANWKAITNLVELKSIDVLTFCASHYIMHNEYRKHWRQLITLKECCARFIEIELKSSHTMYYKIHLAEHSLTTNESLLFDR